MTAVALDQRLIPTEPAPPDVCTLSMLRPDHWQTDVRIAAHKFAEAMFDLDTYGETFRPWDRSETLNGCRADVRTRAAVLCDLVYANTPDLVIDEEDIDHAATVASWILGRKVEVSGWMS